MSYEIKYHKYKAKYIALRDIETARDKGKYIETARDKSKYIETERDKGKYIETARDRSE